MPNERMTFQQVLQQSRDYEVAANELSRFRNNNFQTLPTARINELDAKTRELRDIAQQLLNDAADIVWDNLQPTLQNIREATDKMRKIRSHLINVHRALTFATAAITLGATVLTGNPVAIATAALEVVNTVNTFRAEDDEAAQAEETAVS